MREFDEQRQNRHEPSPDAPAGEAPFGSGDYDEPPFSAAERHRRARMMREARKPNPLLERLATGEYGLEGDLGDPVMDQTFGRSANRAEKGILAGIRRFLFGPRSRGGEEAHAQRSPEPYRGKDYRGGHDRGEYASAVASAVRMAGGFDGPIRADTEFPHGTDQAENESAMYPQPPHHAVYPLQPQPAEQAGQQPAHWPPAQMMQAVAVWPMQPVLGWPMPPQASWTPPQAYGTPWQAHGMPPQAHGIYGAPQQDNGPPYAPAPAHGWPHAAPHPHAAWSEPAQPAFAQADEQEMEDLRHSVHALRDMLEALIQRRLERDRRAA
jgi:hypothetical protein